MSITINKEYTASFDVDAQKTFTPLCPDELPVAEGDQIVPALNQQAKFAKFRLGSKDAHSTHAIWVADKEHPIFSQISGDNVDIRWPTHAVPSTMGFELLDGLPHPKDYNYFVWKGIELDMHPYGACYHDHAQLLSTGAIDYLHKHDVDTVLVGGLALDYCVKVTALQLAQAGFTVIINLASTRGMSVETVELAIEELKSIGIFFINSTDELRL